MARIKTAIVHDWFVGGGAEKVVLELHKMFPEAPIYTSYCADEWRTKLDGRAVTGFLQKWPFSKLRKFLPILRIWWFSRLNFNDFDLVISSSGAEAKGIKTNKSTIHINYCHAPTHYYWSRYDEYMAHPGFGRLDPLARIGLKLLVGPLRRWDRRAAQRPDYMIANSNYIREQIKKYYGREAVVIHPPIDVKAFKLSASGGSSNLRVGFVTAGRQTPYKKIDLAVAACTQLSLPLTVVGNGPDHKRLVKLAGPSIKFVTGATNQEVAKHFGGATAFIFPGVDDFGIVAVEALAAGTPVIAYRGGGALDYISADTGEFFNEQTAQSLEGALQKFNPGNYDQVHIAKKAAEFSPERFRQNFEDFIRKTGILN